MDALHHWVDTWKRAASELEAIRREEIRDADNVKVVAALESLFNHATRTMPLRSDSGLVEMQKVFAKLPQS